MKKSSMGFAFGIAAAILIPTISVSANDGGQSLESRFQQMAEMESGVQNVKKDAYGNITTLMVVGKGKVSRAFSKQRAKQVAGKEAVREARNAFAQWLRPPAAKWSLRKRAEPKAIPVRRFRRRKAWLPKPPPNRARLFPRRRSPDSARFGADMTRTACAS